MRQSGIIGPMCLYALDHHVERLADDHTLAQTLGERISQLDKVKSVLPVETNIVIFDLSDDAPTAAEVVSQLDDDGISVGAFGPKRIRIVTHLDVNPEAGDVLINHMTSVLTRKS